MAQEIERKFLVMGTEWKAGATGLPFRQGYLSSARERIVRVRIEGERGRLTIKGPGVGLVRPEFEYDVPLADAAQMLDTLCEQPLIEKTRYHVRVGRHVWDIDEFDGQNRGLVVAEVELASADELFDRPSWLGREVTHDPRYLNANLIHRPFCTWATAADDRS